MPISRLCVIGYMGPATAPCRARNRISMPMLCEMPHMNEVNANNSVHHTNSLTSPKRRVRKPVKGRAMAMLTANEVITQVLWSLLTPRLPAMVGNDTFAIVVSSTCMNVAKDRPKVLIARLGGRNWVGIECTDVIQGTWEPAHGRCFPGHCRRRASPAHKGFPMVTSGLPP